MSGKREILRCNICLDTMKDERMLPSCGHMFCLACLESYVGHNFEIQCPVCRDKCRVPPGGVRNLPKNIYLKQFLEQLCSQCEKYPRTEACLHCQQTVCAQCRDEHMDQLRNELNDVVCDVDTLNDVKIIKEAKKEKKALADMQKALEKEISKAADDLVRLVRGQEKRLKNELRSCVSAEVRDIETKVRDYQDGIATLKQFTRKYDLRSVSDEQLVDMRTKWTDHYSAIQQTLNDHVTARQKDIACKLDLNEIDRVMDQSWKLVKGDGSEVANLESHRLSVVSSISASSSSSPRLGLDLVPTKTRPVRVFGGAGVGKGKFRSPFGVTVSPTTGNILVADTHNHRIQVLDADGRPVASFGSEGSGVGHFRHPVGVTCTASGEHLLVADTENHRIVITDADGKFVRAFGKAGDGVNDFRQPWGVAIDSSSMNVHITDCGNNRIQVLNIYGRFIRTIGRLDLKSPAGIAIDSNDDIYVADCDNHRIVVYSKYGTKRHTIGSGEGSKPGQLSSPCDVVLDQQGNVIVVEWGNHRVQVFSKEGRSIRIFGGRGSAEGDFNEPRSVTITADNRIIVCDCGNHRLQVF